MLDAYMDGEIDRLYLVYTTFREHHEAGTGRRTAAALQPIEVEQLQRDHWDYLYEPEAKRCSTACSPAMSKPWSTRPWSKLASRTERAHGGHEIGLRQRRGHDQRAQLGYNKARQAAITKELSEIVGGAAAV